MEQKNQCLKKEKLITQTFSLPEFLDTNFANFLNSKRDALNANNCWEIFESLTKTDKRDFLSIQKAMFRSESLNSESLNPKGVYLPEQYFIDTKLYDTISEQLAELSESEKKTIKFLACAKSTGKTLSQNIWIKRNSNNDSSESLEAKKIFWIRCDCEKLMNIVGGISSVGDISGYDKVKPDEDVIGKYFDIQFLYVLCKFYKSEKRPFFHQIINELRGSIISLKTSGDRKESDDDKSSPVAIVDIIEKCHNSIYENEKHYGRDIVFKSSLGILPKYKKEVFNWLKLSKEIQKILQAKGYKLFRIIDSVDNYKKYDTKGKYLQSYKFILQKICTFSSKYLTDEGVGGGVAIIVRKNTFWDYKAQCDCSKREGYNRYNVIHKFIKANNAKEKMSVFERRYGFLRDKLPASNVLKMFEKIIHHKNSSRFLNNFLEKDKHIGYLLQNKFSLIPALIHFQNKYNFSDEHIDTFIDSYLPTHLLLNGHFSLNSFARKGIELGWILFNLFYYNQEIIPKESKLKWHGLCNTRILQFLSSYAEDKGEYKNSLIDTVHNLFGYDRVEIERNLSKLTKFSLVRLHGEEDNPDATTDIDNPEIVVTKKGRESLDFIFSDIDVLYQCALDTPLPTKIIKESFIQSHSNELERRNYAICCLKTSLTFIQYLKTIDEKEMAYIKKHHKDVDVNIYKLPLYKKDIQENLNIRVDFLFKSVLLNEMILQDFKAFLSKFKTKKQENTKEKEIKNENINSESEITKKDSENNKNERTLTAQNLSKDLKTKIKYMIQVAINSSRNDNQTMGLNQLLIDIDNSINIDATILEEILTICNRNKTIPNDSIIVIQYLLKRP